MAGQQLLEQRLPLNERRGRKIEAIQIRQIEGIEDQLVAVAVDERILQMRRSG